MSVICPELQVDPTNKCEIPKEYRMDCIGIVPIWLITSDPELPIRKVVENNYQLTPWNKTNSDNSIVTEEGKYSSYGDPSMYPVARYDRDGDILFQYDYGIIILVEKGDFSKPTWGRVD